jgi:hypothetical protein
MTCDCGKEIAEGEIFNLIMSDNFINKMEDSNV